MVGLGAHLPWEALLSLGEGKGWREWTRPFPVPLPPAHTGASWRLPHCWHSNEKVNIEPKIWG